MSDRWKHRCKAKSQSQDFSGDELGYTPGDRD